MSARLRRSGADASDGADAMDPRIAARRDAIADDRRRRRRRIVLVVAVVVSMLAFAWYLTRTPLFDVDRIDVVGTDVVSTDDVLAASGITVGEPLLEVDTGAAAKNVEALPWVASASVDRRWSGTVTITVTERVEIAVVLDGAGQRMLVDRDGRVLGPDGPFDRADLLIEGVEAGEPGSFLEGADDALTVVSLMGPGVRSRIASISVADDGSITLHLKPQGTVVLGSPTRLEAKIASLEIVLGQVDQRDLASINLVNPETPVVVRTPK